MTDNKPLLLLALVPRLDILRGRLLLSPKNQARDGFKHFYFLFVSSWRVCLLFCLLFLSLFISRLRCCASLYLLNTMQILPHKGHPHVRIPSHQANSNPHLAVWEWALPTFPPMLYIYFFQNPSNLGQLTKMSNEMSCYTVVWIMMPTPSDFYC